MSQPPLSIPDLPSVDALALPGPPSGEFATTPATCYHCRQPVGQPGRWRATLAGSGREFCCAGCEAVARTIHGAGLASFYERRQAVAPPVVGDAADFARFDAAAAQRGLVTEHSDGSREISLLLEGIQCAACVWLNEAHLRRLPGVLTASINYTTRRARVRWQPARIALSQILSAVGDIGYRAHPYDPSLQEQVARREARWLLLRAVIAGLAMMQVMMFAAPAYLSRDGVDAEYERLFRWASLVLTLPAVAFSAWPFLVGAARSLRQRALGMDVPISLGVLVAFAASAWATVTGRGEVYFDSVTMFIALLLAARYFELRARQRASAGVESLARSMPAVADVLVDWPRSRATRTVAIGELEPGQHVLVPPGGTVPADGVVADGVSHADESLVTGESWPVAKSTGSSVLAGSVNRESQLVIRVASAPEGSRVSQILRLAERAMSERPAIGAIADRVAAWSVAAILAAAGLAAAVWLWIDAPRALPVAVAVLVVSCPCALSLAVPTALAATTSALARRGILVTRGDAIESMARLSDVVFDKTGTLTDGRFSLVGVFPLRERSRERCIALAAALEAGSEHPIAGAFRDAAGTGSAVIAGDLHNEPGCGVEGVVDGVRYRLGSPRWAGALHAHPLPLESRLLAPHVTPVALADRHGWIAWITVADRLRSGAASTVSAMRETGLAVHLLSGDRPATVAHYAAALGVDSSQGGLEPEAKVAWLQARQAEGRRVMMIGDGVNDAPVLAGAHVSAAMASGAPLAMLSADVVLLSGDISAVGAATAEARRAFRIMRQNFFWAILYNAIAIPLAAAGSITPLVAGLGMSLSSLLVVLNSLRLTGSEGRRAWDRPAPPLAQRAPTVA